MHDTQSLCSDFGVHLRLSRGSVRHLHGGTIAACARGWRRWWLWCCDCGCSGCRGDCDVWSEYTVDVQWQCSGIMSGGDHVIRYVVTWCDQVLLHNAHCYSEFSCIYCALSTLVQHHPSYTLARHTQAGNLLCCESCPAAYHPKCVSLARVPKDEWVCRSVFFSTLCPILASHIDCGPCLPNISIATLRSALVSSAGMHSTLLTRYFAHPSPSWSP